MKTTIIFSPFFLVKKSIHAFLLIVVLIALGSCSPYPPYESSCELCIFRMEEQYLDHIVVDLVNDSTGVIWCFGGQVPVEAVEANKFIPYQGFARDLTADEVSQISVTPLHNNYFTYIDNPTIGTRKAVVLDCKWEDFEDISYLYLTQECQVGGVWVTETINHKTSTTPAIIGPAFSEICVLPGSLFVKNSHGDVIYSRNELIDRVNHWIDIDKVQKHSAEKYDCYSITSALYSSSYNGWHGKIIIPLKH